MCTTCGCSSDAEPKIINLTPGASDAVPLHAADGRHHDDERSEHDHGEVHHHHRHDHSHHHGPDDRHDDRPLAVRPPHRTRILSLEEDILAKNNRLAERNRGWFEGRNILALNLMSAPGAGKTTLLERMLRHLGRQLSISVIEGDQETSRDAERIRATGCRVVQVNTGSGCHLDADMVGRSVRSLDPPPHSLLVIENVGNLVCPALFDLGEAAKVVIMSVTEGEDKPIKYPHMFRAADLLLLNKVDLLPHLQFDERQCLEYAHRINANLHIIPISATRGDGMEEWYAWLRQRIATGASS